MELLTVLGFLWIFPQAIVNTVSPHKSSENMPYSLYHGLYKRTSDPGLMLACAIIHGRASSPARLQLLWVCQPMLQPPHSFSLEA